MRGSANYYSSTMTFILIAIGIALLGTIITFGNKIKDVKKDIREKERAFLASLNTDWETLRPVLRSEEDPDEVITSFGLLVAGKKLDVPTLNMFRKAERQSEKLKISHSINYYSLIVLIIAIFWGAVFDLCVKDGEKLDLVLLYLSKEVIVIALLIAISLFIVIRLILTRIQEEGFGNLLENIGDRI